MPDLEPGHFHGRKGPMHIEGITYEPALKYWLQAAEELGICPKENSPFEITISSSFLVINPIVIYIFQVIQLLRTQTPYKAKDLDHLTFSRRMESALVHTGDTLFQIC